MKTKILLISIPLLTAVLLTAGCAQAEKTDGQADISAVENMEEFEPLPIPEGGWTYEEVAKTVYINGKPISYPFTIESLGEGYSYKKKTTNIDEKGLGLTTLYYENKPIATLKYRSAGDVRHLERESVDKLFILDVDDWNDPCDYEMIKVNGVGVFDDVSAAKEAYGEPDFESDTGMIISYKYSEAEMENKTISFILEDGKINCIIVNFTDAP